MQKQEWSFNTDAWADEQKLPGFGKLLKSWLQVHQKFCNSCRPENSWEDEFKEWSQVGFLSNAGVLIGGIALEEWEAPKTSNSGDGRNDLFLRLPTQNQTQDYFIEAKRGCIDLPKSENDWAKELSKVMGDAIKGAKELDKKLLLPHKGKAVAVSFLILKFDGEDTANLDERTSTLLHYIRVKQGEQLGLNALASIFFSAEDFQKNRLERKEKDTNDKNNEFVGMIFMAKQVDLT